LSGLQKL